MNLFKSLLIVSVVVLSAAQAFGQIVIDRSHAKIFLDSRHHKFAALDSCGGTVELKMVHGQADLIFRGVRQCSNFDILEANGRPTRYPNKKIHGVNGDRNGSFTIPDYILHYGYNGVVVAVQSNSGIHRDVMYVQFFEH